jgi:hypothetical protein
MKKRNILITLLLLLPLLWTGCTSEDYRNCPIDETRAELYIAFQPINPVNVYPDVVQNVSLYFYDPATELLAYESHYTTDELRNDDKAAKVSEDVLPGTYKVVGVINCGIYTETVDTDSYTTLRSRLMNHELNAKPVDFFAGEKEITIDPGVSTEETMAITKHNKDIHLNIVYDGYEGEEGVTFTSWIEGSNCCYEYAENCNTTHAMYNPWEEAMNTEGLPTRFSYSTMRITTDSDLTLHLEEIAATRGPVRKYSFVLADLLGKLIDENNTDNEYLYDTDEELAFADEFEFTIKIGKDNVLIEVGVDLWDGIGSNINL